MGHPEHNRRAEPKSGFSAAPRGEAARLWPK